MRVKIPLMIFHASFNSFGAKFQKLHNAPAPSNFSNLLIKMVTIVNSGAFLGCRLKSTLALKDLILLLNGKLMQNFCYFR